MKRILLLALIWLAVFPGIVSAQKFKATPENVSEAIKNCVSFLSLEQVKVGDRKGSWVGSSEYGTGQTSLVGRKPRR